MLFTSSRVFIDGGGNNFKGFNSYIKNFPSFDKIYVFEPNPKFINEYKNSNVVYLNKAIWTENKVLPFYLSRDEKQVGSSLIKNKLCRVADKLIPDFQDQPIQVECVDFSQWIVENINPRCKTTLKLDIEGAEYDVLWKMINDGTISRIQTLYVEFHLDHLPEKQESYKSLLKNLEFHGVKPLIWD